MNLPTDDTLWTYTTVTPTISRRDWFAGMAMAALMADYDTVHDTARRCVEYADALIAALDKEAK